ncbi:MAG: hypothetical protein Q7S58_06405 [Candidatus Binatus sp.]|uniref:TPM domain-containing protein n=1 Tax=Candidatus Binatus sp. TaxID=2811406 RepID=UPI002717D0AA|nr:hypothetical protein [Candidatus Binatus sp.]MDO8432029.1 hypothetical protein [Candidatus Binatus sp.]
MQSRFTPEEYARIDAAIGAVERSTAADLDLVVTRVSDRYSLYPPLSAALSAIAVAGVLAILRPALSARIVVLIELITLIALTMLLDWMPIRMMLVSKRIKQTHARQLARREFAAHDGGNPHQRRILLFVSLGEHYVEIIADRATHALAPETVWSKIVADFLATVKSGRIVDGVIAAIEACGAVLATYHPVADDDEGARR